MPSDNFLTKRLLPATLATLATFLSFTVYAHDGSSVGETASIKTEVYSPKSTGVRKLTLGTQEIKMLVDKSNLGSTEIEVGELFLPAGFQGTGDHRHENLEIFYVIEGTLGHEVNGKLYRLEVGDVGIVKAGDTVNHSVLSESSMRALVIWTPGKESAVLINRFNFSEKAME
jgi:quercetin dioxygenase-like cupin family protein